MICTVIPTTLPHFSYTGFHIVPVGISNGKRLMKTTGPLEMLATATAGYNKWTINFMVKTC